MIAKETATYRLALNSAPTGPLSRRDFFCPILNRRTRIMLLALGGGGGEVWAGVGDLGLPGRLRGGGLGLPREVFGRHVEWVVVLSRAACVGDARDRDPARERGRRVGGGGGAGRATSSDVTRTLCCVVQQ